MTQPMPTYPQAPGYPAPQVPQQPAPQQYQQPAMPQQPMGYPQQPAPQAYPAPQGYPMGQPMGYPQQGYPQAPVPQAPPVNATLDDFFSQPSSGWGPAWSWKGQPVGTTYVGIVARAVTQADVQQQTGPNGGAPLFYRDGRPMLVMKVPMNVQPDQRFPEGKAQWYVQGQARDELARAMAEAGAPAGPPEAGAVISVAFTGERPNNFGTTSKQYTVTYQRPQNAGQAPQAQAPAPQGQGVDFAALAAQQQAQAQAPAPQAPVQQQQAQAPVQQQAPAPAAQQPAPPAPAAAEGLDPQQQALLAQLTGQAG